jgi:photosynthetic reaction center cytochrome c subunit
MGAITVWVSPEQGCNYCHTPGNFATEGVYTKTVARRMIQMTQHINETWKDHVGDVGVTCHTCHRGQNVPEYVWSESPGALRALGPAGNKAGQNAPAVQVGLTSLPGDPFSAYLARGDAMKIRVQSNAPLPLDNDSTIMETEWTYGLMVHMSGALGVNCTYCHNSRSFGLWEASSPARVTAWHGIRMVQDLNDAYLAPLTDVFPANRKGPLGDVYKINCATCHQGVYKPLYGESMLPDYPSLAGAHGDAATDDASAADDAGAGGEAPGVEDAEDADSMPATDEASSEGAEPEERSLQNAHEHEPLPPSSLPAPA